MGIENFKRWHWALIGIVVGVALGYMWTSNPTEVEPYTIGTDTFLARLQQTTNTGDPVLTHIRVGPIVEDYRGKKVQPVMVDELRKLAEKDEWAKFTTWQLNASVPFDLNSPNKSNTISDFLALKKKEIPKLDYGDQKLVNPAVNCAVFGLGGLVLIGGVWPTMISVMANHGLAKPPKQKEYDLDRFKSAPDPDVAKPTRPVITADDDAELAALNARLAAATAGLAMTEEDDEDAAAAAAGRPAVPPGSTVRALDSSPDPVRPQTASASDGPKDFKGEFYPVAKPVVKK